LAKKLTPKQIARKRRRRQERREHAGAHAGTAGSDGANDLSSWEIDATGGQGTVVSSQGMAAVVRRDGGLGDGSAENLQAEEYPEGVVPGDRVDIEVTDGIAKIARIHPRNTRIARLRFDSSRDPARGSNEHVIAANVDIAVIVASTISPPFRARLIDRYLVMCQYGEVEPLICVNKIDLVPPDEEALSIFRRVGVPLVSVSAETGEGIDLLRDWISSKTAVLTGHSGVGKSSIANAVTGTDMQYTGSVGAELRGRHTTTTSMLIEWSANSQIIDTPGIRSLGLWDIKREQVPAYFPEFAEPAELCKFRDCHHDTEPDCGVKAALERGDIAENRYDSYLRLVGE
jgi:ribosome biogenesis GTPase